MATTETEISLRGDKRGGTLQRWRGSWRQEASNISLESQILLFWNPEYTFTQTQLMLMDIITNTAWQ